MMREPPCHLGTAPASLQDLMNSIIGNRSSQVADEKKKKSFAFGQLACLGSDRPMRAGYQITLQMREDRTVSVDPPIYSRNRDVV